MLHRTVASIRRRHPSVAGQIVSRSAGSAFRLLQQPGLLVVLPPTMTAPNDLWTADFKGQFRTGNGVYCSPLTIADLHMRYLLTCHGLLSTQTVTAHPIFARAFHEFGLPRALLARVPDTLVGVRILCYTCPYTLEA
ncbi:MAG TPA: hypothetical protein VIK25_01210 [Gemmatimonadaceae bacterium]